MKNSAIKSIWIILPIAFFFLFSHAFGQQTQINSEEAKAYYNRGLAYMDNGQYDQAISDYTKTINIDPRYALAYTGRGNAFERKGEHDRAMSDYTKAIEINPRYAEAYTGRGLAYKRKGKHDRAMSDYTKAIEINPKDAVAYNRLSWLLATAMAPSFRNGKKAVELALKACELSDWKNPGYLDTLAAAYARVGDFGNAVKWQEKALESPELANNTEAQQRLNFYRERKPWPAN